MLAELLFENPLGNAGGEQVPPTRPLTELSAGVGRQSAAEIRTEASDPTGVGATQVSDGGCNGLLSCNESIGKRIVVFLAYHAKGVEEHGAPLDAEIFWNKVAPHLVLRGEEYPPVLKHVGSDDGIF